jgi:hypothetical protein
LFRVLTQVGKETTYGTAVPATRQLLLENTAHEDRQRAAHIIKVATGTRDNVRSIKNRAVTASGTFQQQLDADEIIELFLASIAGGVTPVATVAIANPTTALTATPSASGGTLPSGTYLYEYTDVGQGGGETMVSSPSTGGVVTGPNGSVALTGVLAGAAGTVRRNIYRNFGGGAYGLIGAINDNTTTTFTDTGSTTTAQAALNGAPPGVNSTGTGANVWTFKPSSTLDSLTLEWMDGYRAWQLFGTYFDTLKIAFNATATGDSVVNVTAFGKDRVDMGSITGALTSRTPVWIEGWESAVYIDAMGAAPGVTPFAKAIMGEVTLTNHLGRKYVATNSQATSFVTFGELDVTGSITMEGDASSVPEYNNWDLSVPRLFRWVLGNNGAALGASTLKRKIMLDIPAYYTVADLSGQDANTQILKASFNYSYDVANAFSFAATVVNNRSTAYA